MQLWVFKRLCELVNATLTSIPGQSPKNLDKANNKSKNVKVSKYLHWLLCAVEKARCLVADTGIIILSYVERYIKMNCQYRVYNAGTFSRR